MEKARTFDETRAQELISKLEYQALDQLVLVHLLGK